MTEHDARLGGDRGFRWPPPGLERIQGDLWRAVRSGWLAGALLVLPLLLLTTTSWDLSTLGPLADAWWAGVLAACFGLGFAVDLFLRLARMARRARVAVERGYDPHTVWCVLADRRRDMGFLLQGERHFSVLGKHDREGLVSVRLVAAGLLTAAGVWLCLALSVGLFLGARGWLEPALLRYGTLLPAGGLYLVGIVVALTDDVRVRRARRAWHTGVWEDDLDPERIARWRERARLPPAGPDAGAPPAALARVGTAFTVGAVVVFVPILLLLPASAVGPAVAGMSLPGYERVQRRAAELEVYRIHRVSPDPAITPGEAGRLLQTLAYVGTDAPAAAGEIEPPVRVPRRWLPGPWEHSPLGSAPQQWHEALFGLVSAGLSPEQRSYLAEVAAHEAHADFSRLARALRIDVAGARWAGDGAGDGRTAVLAAPKLEGLRSGAHAHIAAAAYEVAEGRVDAAETLVREVLSVGFLLADQGPTLMDNLVGQALVREGGLALEYLFTTTGRDGRADELAASRATGVRAAARMPAARPRTTEAMARLLPHVVLDSTTVRGLAWESFAALSTLAPCMNLNRIVFGPDEDHQVFLEAAERALVRWPSEERLFRMASRGLLQRADAARFGGLRLLSIAVRSGEGSCRQVLGRLSDGGEME